MKKRVSKEEMYMRIAEIASLRSTCKRLQVGSIVINSDFTNILAMGYNGNYMGGPNDCDSDEPGNCGCLHSEVNAIAKCNYMDKNKILFVTNQPCKMCAKLIINSGFMRVYYRKSYRLKEGIELLKLAGINIIQL